MHCLDFSPAGTGAERAMPLKMAASARVKNCIFGLVWWEEVGLIAGVER